MNNYKCPHCNSYHTEKRGIRGKKRRIYCKNCNKWSSLKLQGTEAAKVRILVLDIETTPLKAYVWKRWKQNVYLDQTISEWFMLTWSAKWLFEEEVYSDRLVEEEVYAENDKRICNSLRALLDEADIVITHNGDRFDLPKIKSRLLINDLPLVTPYLSVDTCKIAAKQFGFSSNKLEGLARVFGFEGKFETGFNLWARCMNGDEEALEYMEKYNRQDVLLLEEVYLKLRPYILNHPNVSLFLDMDKPRCTVCGSEHIHAEGEYNTQVNSYTTYRCDDCGSIAGRSRKSSINVKNKKNLLSPVAK